MTRGKSAMTEPADLEPMSSPTITLPDAMLDGFDPIEREAYEWIARFVAGQMRPSDIEAMKRWYGQSPAHAAAYAEVRRVWLGLGPAASAVMLRNGEARGAGGLRPFRPDGAPSVGRRAFLAGALAASAAAGAYALIRPPFDLWPSYAELTADFRTETGEQRQVTLGKAVSLDLNTRTSVAVRSETASATHLALISGEAAISIGAGAASLPLTVEAGAGRVLADRANFNLRCEDAAVVVTCLEGTLKVEAGNAATTLVARQQVGYGARGIGPMMSVDPDAVTAWQRGMLIFDGIPVAQVVAEVNRYRPGRIILMNQEIGRHLLSAQLRIAEAGEVITQIVHIFGAKATNLPGGIVILT
jgi:transmembrane sensor